MGYVTVLLAAAAAIAALVLALLIAGLAAAALADTLDHRRADVAAGRPVGSLWQHFRQVLRALR